MDSTAGWHLPRPASEVGKHRGLRLVTLGVILKQSHRQCPRAPVPGPGTAFVSSLLAEDTVGFCLESPLAPCQDGLLVALCSFHDLLCFCIPLIKDETTP